MNRPWLAHYGSVPHHLNYPQGSMSDAVFSAAEKYPAYPALSFMGRSISYERLVEEIGKTAAAFRRIGVKEGDRVTLCLPNIPQTVYALYALNELGAVVSLIHPLSAEKEIVFYLQEAGSTVLVGLHQFYEKLEAVQRQVPLQQLLITDIDDALSGFKRLGYRLAVKRKFPLLRNALRWAEFIEGAAGYQKVPMTAEEGAVLLFSGGTTGSAKGILLSNKNFNALAMQTAAMAARPLAGKRLLAAMPMFHGFGLGVCVHTALIHGACSVLVPRFNVKECSAEYNRKRAYDVAE